MENHPLSVWNSTFEEDDFLFQPISCQFPTSVHILGNADDTYHQSCQYEQMTSPNYCLPLTNTNETLMIEPAPLTIQDYGFHDDLPTWMEGGSSAVAGPSTVNNEAATEGKKKTKGKKKITRRRKGKAKVITKEQISEYFYLPIMQAAKELNVSLTSLKVRCREVGILYWPRRKLTSLENLISNIRGQEEEPSQNKRKRAAVEKLEREKKLLEEAPDVPLDDETKRLRKACAKANYMKRRIKVMTEMLEAEIKELESLCMENTLARTSE